MKQLNDLLDRAEQLEHAERESDAVFRLTLIAQKAEVWRQINAILAQA